MNWKKYRADGLCLRFLSITAFFFLSIEIGAQETFLLSGYALADESKECLIGATISSGDKWAVSNELGFFSIRLKRGEHVLKCSYVGREAKEKKLNIKKQ